MNGQRGMTKAERRADNQAKRIDSVQLHRHRQRKAIKRIMYRMPDCVSAHERLACPTAWDAEIDRHMARDGEVMIVTTTAGGPTVVEHVGMEDIGEGVTIHTPNMVCMDPNCNLPHGHDALFLAVQADPETRDLPSQIIDAYNNGVIERNGFTSGNPDCLASVIIDESSPLTPEAVQALRDFKMPEGVVIHSVHTPVSDRKLVDYCDDSCPTTPTKPINDGTTSCS